MGGRHDAIYLDEKGIVHVLNKVRDKISAGNGDDLCVPTHYVMDAQYDELICWILLDPNSITDNGSTNSITNGITTSITTNSSAVGSTNGINNSTTNNGSTSGPGRHYHDVGRGTSKRGAGGH